jgi:hypothetical protein
MSDIFQCGDNTGLVSYLYNECELAERVAIEAHIRICAACAAEVAALESARFQLASWTPPEADLGFAIVRPQSSTSGARKDSAAGWPGAWLHHPLPVWAQAVAACLIFGVGLSLGVLRGTAPEPSSGTQSAARVSTGAPAMATATDLAALERRLRAEMATLRTTSVSATAAAPQSPGNAQVLAQVRALIDESEQRQQRELALRTAQVVRDFDLQRRVDLAQIQRNFGQIEGVTGAEVREQREMLNYLLRVSEQR